VIPKLPFPNPVDPLVAGISNKMKAEGKNAFKEFFVPEAFIELRQGLGRLIRSEEDSGKVLILDNRIVVEHYGKTFMRIWNNKQKVVGSIDEIKTLLK
jgi:ATP-dependent DNA helicase DinG